MAISEEKTEMFDTIAKFDLRIEEMHQGFLKYQMGEADRMPDWESLEGEIVQYSQRKIFEMEISNRLTQVLYKFQNRKKIWLKWVEEYQEFE